MEKRVEDIVKNAGLKNIYKSQSWGVWADVGTEEQKNKAWIMP